MSSVSLGDSSCFELVSGLWKGAVGPFVSARVIRGTNFGADGLLVFDSVVELEVEARHVNTRRLQQGDILVERSGGGPKQPVGRVVIFQPPDSKTYFTSNFTTAIRVKDLTQFEPQFVALYLHDLYLLGTTIPLQRATTGLRNLDWREYLRFEVPELPLTEQRQISDVCTFVRHAAVVEGDLEDAATCLKASAMRELFTRGLRGEQMRDTEIGPVPASWDVVPFGNAREWLQYGTSVRCSVEPAAYPVLRIPNIEPGAVNPTDLKYCQLSDEEAENYLLHDGDLIFIRTNGVLERLGRCAVYRGEPTRALFASYLIRARLKPGMDPRFVAYFYESDLGNGLVASRATPAADGKYNLNTGAIDSLALPVPPTIEEQRDIVRILDAIDTKIDLHRRKRGLLENLFKSLLHKLMTGEVRVTDLDLSALPALSEASP